MRYNAGNVGVIEYDYIHVTPTKTQISRISCTFLDGHTYTTNCLDDFFEWITNDRARLLFVWDFNFFGAFLDYWALTHNIPLYDKASVARGGNGRSIAQECFSALYTGRGMLNFKITLQRTKSTHRQYYKQGTSSYHTTEFRGLAPYFGGLKLGAAMESCGIGTMSKSEALLKLLEFCSVAYEDITGIDFFNSHFLASTYTVGRAARDLYLKTRYGKISLTAYQKEHAQTEALEDYFRERNLLLGGMCITNPKYTGALCVRKHPKCFYKYDKNGLYTYIANKVGELGYPEPSTFNEYYNDKTGMYAYIIVFKNLEMIRKPQYPQAFIDPFLKTEGDGIEINTEYAIFGELYEMLNVFYDVISGEVLHVYKCKKSPDPSMIKYNEHILKFKDRGRSTENRALYTIAKIFLNGLLGKFSQQTKSTPVEAYFDAGCDMVRFALGTPINAWGTKHFDYIRGAYIYVMARVEMMKDMCALFKDQKTIIAKHWYTDTDSIVTDIEFPKEYIDPVELGKYKIEEKYIAFGVVCKKMYYGRTVDGADKLTCAGIPKDDVINGLKTAFPNGLTPFQYFNYLNSDNGIDLNIAMRCSGGSMVGTVKYTLNYVTAPLEF